MKKKIPEITTPAPLKKGDTIGIIAPAGNIHDVRKMENGIRILQKMGFKIKCSANFWPGKDYLADTDIKRAKEFLAMWYDPEVKALLAVRGGFGSLRLISVLEKYKLKDRKKAKHIIGFSDITALHYYFFGKYNISTLHGPVLTSLEDLSKASLKRFYLAMTDKTPAPVVHPHIKVLKAGKRKQGRLIGGNLSTVVSLLGTRFDLKSKNRMLFLEDINEPAYKIDRMMTQLSLGGKLNHISGLLLGDFTGDMDGDRKKKLEKKIWGRVLEICENYSFPIVGRFPSGHCRDNYPLHFGRTVKFARSLKEIQYV